MQHALDAASLEHDGRVADNTASKETWRKASVTAQLISTNAIGARRALSCRARATRNGRVCCVRRPIAQPPYHRRMVRFDAGGLIRRQLVAPTAGVAATEKAVRRHRCCASMRLPTRASRRPSPISCADSEPQAMIFVRAATPGSTASPRREPESQPRRGSKTACRSKTRWARSWGLPWQTIRQLR
jgi:hypothetical protein